VEKVRFFIEWFVIEDIRYVMSMPSDRFGDKQPFWTNARLLVHDLWIHLCCNLDDLRRFVRVRGDKVAFYADQDRESDEFMEWFKGRGKEKGGQ